MTEEELFHQALERPAGERAAFLLAACGDDLAMRQRVEVLLGAHEDPGSFLQGGSPVFAPTIDQPTVSEGPGTAIGPYKLLEQIGEGGFGVVFLAEQQQPVRRKVALKVIKPGMDTRQVIARFEAERQALAIMDHPHIAKVLDAGATASGRPYFVMELVRGVPITDYCDQHKLDPQKRLELFVTVCQAVQHAHSKGIIHRDIKPTNVLVTLHDDKPVVKVIDFGIAKATTGQLTDKTLFTSLAQMIGTPLYMSPEQAGLSGLDIDTRSDVYSLGVLLYELLTGTTPFEKHRLQQAAYEEVRRIIREEEPPKPSTRLSELSSPHAPREELNGFGTRSVPTTLASISAQRHIEPAKLTKLVRGDLDWIVMKALEKDRARRYETANGFAADVLRYLADEPVTACPPSAAYRFRKFARRNKAALATIIVVSASLLTAVAVLAVSNTLIRRESHAKALALGERDRALGTARYQEGVAKQNAARAEEQRGIAERNEGVAKANELLARRRFYASQTNLAMHAFEAGQVVRTVELLETLRPRFDEEDLRTFEWYYLWRQCYGHLELSLPLKPDASFRVAYSPDGSLRALACSDGTITLYDTATNQERKTLRAQGLGWTQIGFSPDGKMLAQLARGPQVILWDVAAGREAGTLTDVGDATRLTVSPVGDTLAVSNPDGTVRVWDLAGERWKATFQAFPADPTRQRSSVTMAYSRDGRTLAASGGSTGFPTNLWDITSDPPALLRRIPFSAIAAAFSPDGKSLALGSWGIVSLWDVAPEPPTNLASWLWGDCFELAFSSDGRFLASANQSKDATLIEVATGKVRSFPHAATVRSVAFSPDGHHLTSVSDDATLKVWRIDDASATDVLPTPDGVMAVACSHDGRLLARGTGGGFIHLHELATGRLVTTLAKHAYPVQVIAFSSDDSYLASGAGDWSPGWPGEAKIWDMAGGREPVTLPGLSKSTWALAFAPDGHTLATGSHDGVLRLWDVPSGRLLSANDTGSVVMSLATTDGGTLISSGNRGLVQLWENDGRELSRPVTLQKTNDGALKTYGVACSPDGRLAAAGNSDGSLRVWELPGGRTRVTMKGHPVRIWSLVFLDEGRTLASLDNAGNLKFWDTVTGQERMAMIFPGCLRMAVVPDGQTLIVCNATLNLLHTSQDREALAVKDELDPADHNSPIARILSGDRLWATGRIQEARAEYDEASARLARLVAHFPETAAYRREQVRGTLRLQLLPTDDGQIPKGNDLAGGALRETADLPDDQGPSAVRSLGELGTLLLTAGRSSDAERVSTVAIELQPDDANCWYLRAQLYQAAGRTEEALADYARALELSPDSAVLRNNLAWSLVTDPDERRRDAARAVALARQAVELSPAQGIYWNTLGVALYRAGSAREALTAIEKSMDLLGDNDWSYNGFILAMCSWQMGDPEQGARWLTQASAWMDEHAPQDDELRHFRAEAEALLGPWDVIAAAYSGALEKTPDRAELWRGRAVANVQRKKPEQALADYARAIELAPDDPATPHCYAARAAIYHELAQDDQALEELTKATEQLPGLWEAWAWRGDFQRDREHWEAAIADYSKALELKPDDWVGWQARGLASAHLKQWENAFADCLHTVEHNPGLLSETVGQFTAHGWTAEAETLLRRIFDWATGLPAEGRAAEAEQIMAAVLVEGEKLFEEAPVDRQRQALAEDYGTLGRTLLAEDKQEAAAEAYAHAVEKSPENATTWRELGRLHLSLGRAADAVCEFSKAIELAPNGGDTPWWRLERTYSYRALKQDDKALAELNQIIQDRPNLWDAWVWRAAFRYDHQEWEQSVADFDRGLALNPNYWQGWWMRGVAAVRLARWAVALESYDKALALNPEGAEYPNDLAWLLATCPDAGLRDPARAVEMARKVTEKEPQAGRYWIALGAAQYRAGEWQAAGEALDRAVELQWGNASALFFLAMAHWQLDQKDEARASYDKAVQWMEANGKDNEELIRFRAEAEELLGVATNTNEPVSVHGPDNTP